jgi:hypothetical protein
MYFGLEEFAVDGIAESTEKYPVSFNNINSDRKAHHTQCC